MKNTIQFKVRVLGMIALLFAGSAVAQGQASNLVLLKVSDDQSALEYNASGSSVGTCSSNPGNGCVRVSGVGSITYRLVNRRQCDSGGFWELDGVQFGAENSDRKTGSWGNLSAGAAADFGANATSGWAGTQADGNGGLTVTDYNSAEYVIWYRVQASCGDETIEFDPPVENDGTGRLP